MPTLNIPYERLLRQRIAGEALPEPAALVRWMGAIQAQDYAAAKWAVGMRIESGSDAQLDEALSRGDILRTHVMRPTWHFIASEDIRWMQALTAARVRALMASQYRQLELHTGVYKRSRPILEKALRDGQQLTRAELGAALKEAGIEASGLRLAHILIRVELDAVICSGGRRGKQFTYALVAERAPHARELQYDEALALLTQRYFTSHGPATLRDYAWWSGLPLAEVKKGLESVKTKLMCEALDGQDYWMPASAPAARFPRGAIHLLSNYDEYVVGYTDRGAIFDSMHAQHLDARHNPLFNNTIVSNGRIVGTWKRTIGARGFNIEARFFEAPSKAETRGLGLAVKRLAEFMQLPVADFRLA